jgi:hypothetical protein
MVASLDVLIVGVEYFSEVVIDPSRTDEPGSAL